MRTGRLKFCEICRVKIEWQPDGSRPDVTCGKPLCISMRRYWKRYGRRPPTVWVTWWKATEALRAAREAA